MIDATLLVVDRGLFLPFALKLAQQVQRVLYYVANDSPFPTPNLSVIGDGFAEIERVRELWGHPVDAFVFPDVGNAALQAELRRQGFPVWGSGAASDLELKRYAFKQKQSELGMKVPPFQMITGLTRLRELLHDTEESYVKISTYRGTMETFHHHNWYHTQIWLDHLATLLGPLQNDMPFLVEEPLEAVVETGLDTYCVAGEYPQNVVQGIEAKDKGYAGTVTAWKELPPQLAEIAERLKPELGEYANFMSLEVRVTKDKTGYLTDPSMRHASPAGECLLELIDNLGEVVLQGARGQLIEPQYTQRFAMQALCDHPEDETGWRSAQIDADVLPWFKPYSACYLQDTIYWPPLPWSCETVGSVVATGSSFGECLETLKERAESLEHSGLEVHLTSLADVIHAIESEEKAGLPFTESPLPAPAEVLPES